MVCSFRELRCEKHFWQRSHWNGFSLVWVMVWTFCHRSINCFSLNSICFGYSLNSLTWVISRGGSRICKKGGWDPKGGGAGAIFFSVPLFGLRSCFTYLYISLWKFIKTYYFFKWGCVENRTSDQNHKSNYRTTRPARDELPDIRF